MRAEGLRAGGEGPRAVGADDTPLRCNSLSCTKRELLIKLRTPPFYNLASSIRRRHHEGYYSPSTFAPRMKPRAFSRVQPRAVSETPSTHACTCAVDVPNVDVPTVNSACNHSLFPSFRHRACYRCEAHMRFSTLLRRPDRIS